MWLVCLTCSNFFRAFRDSCMHDNGQTDNWHNNFYRKNSLVKYLYIFIIKHKIFQLFGTNTLLSSTLGWQWYPTLFRCISHPSNWWKRRPLPGSQWWLGNKIMETKGSYSELGVFFSEFLFGVDILLSFWHKMNTFWHTVYHMKTNVTIKMKCS